MQLLCANYLCPASAVIRLSESPFWKHSNLGRRLEHRQCKRALTPGLRHGPRAFKDQGDLWELLWSKYWLTEFFCDLYAVCTLGPAFAWSHLHLYLRMGGDAFALPDGIRNITHPADDARMRIVLAALRRSGFQSDAQEISRRWQEALRLTTDFGGA